MKIIKQSFEILPETRELAKLVNQIGHRARICYKSEPKGDESKFVANLTKNGHMSCLEMGAVSVLLPEVILDLLPVNSRFFEIDGLSGDNWLVTGTVRAWMEALQKGLEVLDFLGSYNWLEEAEGGVYNITELDIDVQKRHIWRAVKFVTNRAVSHELVRHRPCSFLQESQRYVRYDGSTESRELTFIEPIFFDRSTTDGKLLWADWESTCIDAEMRYNRMIAKGASPQAARTILPNSTKTEIIVYANLRQWEHIFAMRTGPECDPSMVEAMGPVWGAFQREWPGLFEHPKRLGGAGYRHGSIND